MSSDNRHKVCSFVHVHAYSTVYPNRFHPYSHIQILYCYFRTRDIKDALLVPAQRAVLMYGLPLEDIRSRLSSFRRNKSAVAEATGCKRIQSACTSVNPETSLLQFIEGLYTTTEPATVQVASGNRLCTHTHTHTH